MRAVDFVACLVQQTRAGLKPYIDERAINWNCRVNPVASSSSLSALQSN
jgi:hypothetical protein